MFVQGVRAVLAAFGSLIAPAQDAREKHLLDPVLSILEASVLLEGRLCLEILWFRYSLIKIFLLKA
ncbi:MAG: hypothetical protein DRP79_06640 [Planctomycetota bacterium]|nr:MAG: hypothetical protein DRP79_06640 [Planctomycetota bacterium]